jgi:hypothetical protein
MNFRHTLPEIRWQSCLSPLPNLIYTSANQTNLIVPYEVAGKTSTVMHLVYAAAAGTL